MITGENEMSTYTQLYIHIVFRVKNYQMSLPKDSRTKIYKYMTGIIKNLGHKPITINGVSDHCHILVGMNPEKTISDLVKEVKRSSTNFINEKKLVRGKFYWQDGYGAFSYSRSQLEPLINYIKNQEEHHKKKTFREEYVEILDKFGIEYDAKWINT